MIQKRKKADPQAVERRRHSRKLKFRKDSHRRQERNDELQRQRSLESAYRLVERAIEMERAAFLHRRSLRGSAQAENDIRELPEYWLLRHFGYDVRSKQFTQSQRSDGTITFVRPIDTDIWQWWMSQDLSEMVKQMEAGNIVRICPLRQIIAECFPNDLTSTVADAESARRKYARLLTEQRRIIVLDRSAHRTG